VWLSASSDRGRSFSPALQLAGTPDLSEDLHLCASDSAVYVAWTAEYVGELRIRHSLDHGATWPGSAVTIDHEPASSTGVVSPALACSGTDVFAVWLSPRNGKNDVYFNRSTDGGATWLAQDVRIETDSPGAAHSYAPQVTVTGSTVYVTWFDDREQFANNLPRINVSHDRGQTWLAQDVTISQTEGYATQTSLIADDNFVYLGYRSSAAQPTIASSSDHGATWTTHIPDLGSAPVLAAEGDHVWACWTRSDVWVASSSDAGQTWSPRVRVDHSPLNWHPAAAPQIAVHDGIVGVAWVDSRPFLFNNPDLYFTHSNPGGLTWPLYDVRLTTTPNQQPRDHRLVVLGDGFAALWNDGDVRFNIPHGVQPFGSGTPGTGGIEPSLRDTGATVLGSALDVQLEDGLGGAPAVWVLGVTETALPLAGGTLLVDPTATLAFLLDGAPGGAGAGGGSITLPMPNIYTTGAVGMKFLLQAVVLDPAATDSLSLTAALELWIG
jgi:hypothetical protein